MTTIKNPDGTIAFRDDSEVNAGKNGVNSNTWKGGTGLGSIGTGGASDADAARYREQGVAAQDRTAPTVDRSRLNQATAGFGANVQEGINRQRAATQGLSGNGPSAATAQGQLANSSALKSMLQSRARGASVANALGGGAAQSSQIAQQVGSSRAGEIAARQDAYNASAAGLRGTEQAAAGAYGKLGQVQYGTANADAGLAIGQRNLNNAYQQAMEQNAFNVQQAQTNAELSNEARNAGIGAFNNNDRQAATNLAFDYTGKAANAAGTLAATGASYYGGAGNGSSGGAGYGGSGGGGAPATSMNIGTIDAKNPYDDGSYYSDERTKNREPRSVESSGGRPMFTASSGVDPLARGDSPLRQFPAEEGKEPMYREEYPGDVKIALEEEDARKASKRAGVTPLDIKTGGKRPALYLKDLVQQRNEHPNLADVIIDEPDQGVVADANRKMAGEPYTYKDPFVPPDETPGQMHYGFMAQNLEKNPVTATAVETGPDGLKRVHQARMVQAMGTGIADLQRQMDELRSRK